MLIFRAYPLFLSAAFAIMIFFANFALNTFLLPTI